MIQYLISLIVFLAGIVLTIFTAGGSIWNYLDIPSLVIVGIFPFLFTKVLFGFKETNSVFSISIKKEMEKEKLINALNFFKIYGKITWITGYIVMLIEVITILISLEDKTTLGRNLALAIISILYSGIINVVIIIPFTVFIKKQLKE
jgi:flagellar motor component MotA